MKKGRKNRKGRGSRRTGKKTYSIIVDGETEVWYFQMMKAHEELPKVDVKPELPNKKKLADQFESVKANCKSGYDKVIWLVDFDTIIKEEKEKRKEGKSIIQEFKNYYRQLQEYENVEVFINTPCLEFWHLLHFRQTGKYYSKCENAEKDLRKNHLNDYEKSEKYYKKKNNDIYLKLKPNQKTARNNAKLLGDFDFQELESAKAEIYKIFDLLEIH